MNGGRTATGPVLWGSFLAPDWLYEGELYDGTLIRFVMGHVGQERFLDVLEARRATCDVDAVEYGYLRPSPGGLVYQEENAAGAMPVTLTRVWGSVRLS